MSYKFPNISKFFLIILFLVIIIPFIFFFLSNNSSGDELSKDELRKTGFPGYMYDRFSPADIIFSDSCIYSTFITFYENNSSGTFDNNLFYVRKNQCENYLINTENIIESTSNAISVPLVKVNFPFINQKDNLYPYLNPLLAIKMVHIFSKVKYLPRFSDAMRSDIQQNKYKRRGWSDVSQSPHMLGLAFDISKFSWEDKKIIKKISEDMGLKFLQHGGKRNNHIHIQEQKIWETIESKIDVDSISTALTNKVLNNFTFFEVQKPYLMGIREQSNNFLKISFSPDRPSILKIIFTQTINNKIFELTAGVFEKGTKTFSFIYDFLPAGGYTALVYLNNKLISSNPFIKY